MFSSFVVSLGEDYDEVFSFLGGSHWLVMQKEHNSTPFPHSSHFTTHSHLHIWQ